MPHPSAPSPGHRVRPPRHVGPVGGAAHAAPARATSRSTAPRPTARAHGPARSWRWLAVAAAAALLSLPWLGLAWLRWVSLD